MQLSDELRQFQQGIREFVDNRLMPHAEWLDKEQFIDRSLIESLANQGYLAAPIRRKNDGSGYTTHQLMILHKELARAHGSIENLITVTGMVAASIERFAKTDVMKGYLKKLAEGSKIGAFAMTEPDVGSGLSDVTTTITRDGDDYVVNGTKTWITLAQIADFFVVLGRSSETRTQMIVIDRATPGLTVEPISDMVGLRANMLATVTFDHCRVSADYLLGSEAQGLALPATFGLHEGRFTTACGCMGLADAALDIMTAHALTREQSRKKLYRHQLVQKLLTETLVAVKASQELLNRAAEARDTASPDMVQAIMIAKYSASLTARLATDNAVQLLGASGCQSGRLVERYFRDAKVMEIIEGTTQVYEIQIALAHVASNRKRVSL